jgi:hypothetical protein
MSTNKFSENEAGFKNSINQIHRIARAHKNWNKCFGIGYNKTGTTSLDVVLSTILGFKSNQAFVETNSTLQTIKGNYSPLYQSLKCLDFHQDLPISQGYIFASLDALFPSSKFILTVRDNPAWVNSLIKQYRIPFLDIATGTQRIKNAHLFPGYSHYWINHYMKEPLDILKGEVDYSSFKSLEDYQTYQFSENFKKACINTYSQRNSSIQDHFRNRSDDLLTIDITKETCIDKIRDFLELPASFSAYMPHSNAKSKDQPENSLITVMLTD